MNNSEARLALTDLHNTRRDLIKAIGRKRTMRDSEKAMSTARYRRQMAALEMAMAALQDETTPLIKAIQDALGTAETGEGLIETARNAHKAEQELAARINAEDHARSW